MRKSIAYLNYGRWVAECPRPGCASALAVESPTKDDLVSCLDAHCRAPYKVVWPSEWREISRTVANRLPQHQNWFPKNHPRALEWNKPHGQTVADLVAEEALAKTGELLELSPGQVMVSAVFSDEV